MSEIQTFGELIQEVKQSSFNPMLHIQADWIPNYHNWRMIRYSINNGGDLDVDNLLHMESDGWKPVAASTRPEFKELEYKGCVLYKGLILSYKPVTVALANEMVDELDIQKVQLTISDNHGVEFITYSEPLIVEGRRGSE